MKIFNTIQLIENANKIDLSERKGYISNIQSLDNIARICKQQLTIITARANSGKSTFIDYYCYMLAKHSNIKTLFISFETDAVLHTSLLLRYCNTDLLQNNLMFADTTELNSIENIIEVIQYAKDNYNVDNIVIDPFNFISTDQTNDTNQICKVLKELKQTAIKCNVSIILVAHPKKLLKDEEITGESINGSIHFRNVADLILILTTDFNNNTTTIKVDKLRYNKMQGQINAQTTLQYEQQGTFCDVVDIDINNLFNTNTQSNNTNTESNTEINFNELMQTKVSYLQNVYTKQTKEITLQEALTTKAEEVISKQEQLRQLQTKEEIQAYKRDNLPLFSPSVVFNTNGTTANNITSINNIICIDIDAQDNNYISANEMKEIVKNIPYVFYSQTSASGKGIFCLIQIKDTNKFKEHFNAIVDLFKQNNLNIDKQCNDINRKRFISYDNKPYINKNALIFKEIKDICAYQNNETKAYNNNFVFPTDWKNMSDVEKADYIVNYCIKNNILINKTHSSSLKLCSIFKTIYADSETAINNAIKLRQMRKNADVQKIINMFNSCNKINYAIQTLICMFKAA